MVRKLRAEGATEIAVMEVARVGVRTRTRARAETMAAAASFESAKRRKLNTSGESRNDLSFIQLRSRRIKTGTITVSEIIDHDHVSTSWCSSQGSSERIEFVDLKDDGVDVEVETSTYNGCTERVETTESSKFEAEAEEESDDMDSTMKQPSSDAASLRGSKMEKMPTDSEIEDFFAAAEEKLVKRIEEKYNFDFVKEKPKEGRYEWIRLRP